MTALLLALLATSPAPERPRLVVLDLTGGPGVDVGMLQPLQTAIAAEVTARGFFEVVTAEDLRTLLGLERQRQLMGCTESSCTTELAGALGARFVLSGSLTKLGATWQLTLTTLDTQRGQPVGRSVRLDTSAEALRQRLAISVAEATGTPLPPPPSRVVPTTLLVAGGVATAFGLAWGGVHLAQEQQLIARLEAARMTPGVVGTLAEARVESQRLNVQKLVALGALVAGVGLGVAGVLTMPGDGASRVSLVPSHEGVLVMGSF
ncbi:MAG: hypothetical protein JNJ54_35965 [Myxococcaceae bacterium]|nr:hypothetical protein [Myxococcaceae bacterium]